MFQLVTNLIMCLCVNGERRKNLILHHWITLPLQIRMAFLKCSVRQRWLEADLLDILITEPGWSVL